MTETKLGINFFKDKDVILNYGKSTMKNDNLLFVILLMLFSLLPTLLYSQVDTAWVRRYNGSGNSTDEANAIAVDGLGNVYVAGYSWGLTTNTDFTTIKYYTNGNTAWIRRYDGSGLEDMVHAITVDDSGNVYVTGHSYGSVTYLDYATIKYRANGDTAWIRRYNGPVTGEDIAYAVAVDNAENVYVTGSSFGSGTNRDYMTIKYNSAGVQQWVQRYNGPGNSEDRAYAIAVDGSGNAYVTGRSSGTSYDYATVKYNSAGVEQWAQRYNGSGNGWDEAYAIAIDGSGNVYVTGYSYGAGANNDYLTIKYNSAGVQQWVQRYNGSGDAEDRACGIAVDGSGNIYVTGYSYGFGTHLDYAIIKYNSAGAQQWVQRYNGPGNAADQAYAIALDSAGNVYVTGFDAGSISDYDYATIKYNTLGVEQWVQRYAGPGSSINYAYALAIDRQANVYVTGRSDGPGTSADYATIKYVQTQGIEENHQPLSADRLSLEVYPNPARSYFTIRLPKTANRIKIYDITGKAVKEIGDCFALARNDNAVRIPLNGIKNGIYFVKADNFNQVIKLIVTK